MIHVVRALTFQRLMSLYTGSYNKIINSLRFIVKNDLLTRSDAFIHNLWSLIFNFFFVIKICTIGIFVVHFGKIRLLLFQFVWHYSFLNSSRSSLWSVRYFSRYSASRFQPSLKQFLAGTAILAEANGDFGKTLRL